MEEYQSESSFRAGDRVVCYRECSEESIRIGDTDQVESVSSDHHGGWQLNLVQRGRGWSSFYWKRVKIQTTKGNNHERI